MQLSHWLLKILLKHQTSQFLNLQAILENIADHGGMMNVNKQKRDSRKPGDFFVGIPLLQIYIKYKQARGNQRKIRRKTQSMDNLSVKHTYDTSCKHLWHCIK